MLKPGRVDRMLCAMFGLIVAFALIGGIHEVNAFVGYDCGGSTLKVATFSLDDVKECDIPSTEPEPIPTFIQLLQLSEFSNTAIVQCRIEISRIITHCGMHSHSSLVHNGFREYLHELDETSCRRVHETGFIRLGHAAEVHGLRRNDTTTRTITLAGSITMDGQCQGTEYSDPFGTWSDVVVQASLKISLFNYQAAVNLQTEKVVLPSGTQCQLGDGTCIDIEGNSVFWKSTPAESCNFDMYDVLYEGIASKFVNNEDGSRLPDVYTLVTGQTTFALAKQSEYLVCRCRLIRTEHPKLFILETQKGQSCATKKKISVNNLDMFSYINSKFINVEIHVRKQMKNLYRDVVSQRCNLERQILQGALSTAALLPERFARTVMKGPGYTAVIAGEVAHIIKCIPVDCKVRRIEECFQELPVVCRNESFFLSVTSRILARSGTQINCDHVVPPQYQIEGHWYQFYPGPAEVRPPQSLEPLSKPNWKYASPGNLASSGIYSETDINKLRERIMFPAEKPALRNNIARSVRLYASRMQSRDTASV